MIKCCIFDLDGTLLNTVTTITYYVNLVLTEEGIAPISEEECKIFVGNGAGMLIKRALTSRGVYTEERHASLLEKYNNAYNSAPLYLTQPYAGIKTLVDELSARGIVLGVISNKPESATVPIVKHFFGDSISFIRGGREGVALKPSATVPLDVLREADILPSETAFIGDTAVDILTGKNMKATLTVGVLWGFRDESELAGAGADVLVNNTDELLGRIVNA